MNINIELGQWQTIGLIIDYSIKLVAIGFVPENRRPSSSNAWLLVILALPYLGLPLFLSMGSPYINQRRHRVQEAATQQIINVHKNVPDYPEGVVNLNPELASVIKLNRTLTAMPAVTGTNHGVHSNYEEIIAAMARAVDKAKHYVHVEIYIVAWDNTTDVFFRALARAVQRGVKVRLLLDHIGSRKYPGFHKLGRRLDAIGVEWYLMLPLLPLRWRWRRPDLRNHRKMLIIDGERGFLGSLNMIDSSYLMPKNIREGRRWVDVMVELSGPVIASMNTIFAVDWLMESDELLEIVDQVHPEIDRDQVNVVQLVPSGPGYSTEPNLRMFNSIIHHAKERLVMCSPYFIPDESMLEAVTSACYRGVRVELLVSEQADQFAVGHAQSSYYQALLEAGVHIYLYKAPYVLHSKYVLADPDSPDAVGAVGSSNMDMRSFGLNYEVSLMITRGNIIAQLDDLTNEYLRNSTELTLDEWNNRSYARRYVDNIMRLTSALQ
ncbi:cardiolipin synthase [Corynebacterium matruchotii]|uniref:cardiolipin synthase n=1 Tax=Corynebacterium matruchotii TaxID=43768 RepID=UPI0028E1CAEF|nr:cardiolipin synthase [Corynebacterium matruchotii]